MRFTVTPKPVVQTEVAPARAERLPDGTLFLDFAQAAFGTLIVPSTHASIVVHLGESLDGAGRVNRQPLGSIRYIRLEGPPGRLIIPHDQRNTGRGAIKMPPEVGEVIPFRYAEIEDAGDIDPAAVRQVRVHYPFDDDAASFESSDDALNAVWNLCKYSIKATSFAGIYIDGDRERIPYEADAYINQLCHYGVDAAYDIGRYTWQYLLQRPTWPTEWQMHAVMMAYIDYVYTGDTEPLAAFYEALCDKTLIELARDDGLISVQSERCTPAFEKRLGLHGETYIHPAGLRDLVDWPPGSFTQGGIGERDNHEMLPINTVVNAFHYHALMLMSDIAAALNRTDDQARFARQAAKVRDAFNRLLFDASQGVYIDGEGSTHASLHSNMFPLAFDLVPRDRRDGVIAFIKSRGMACSPYGSQYLLEGLYRNGEAQYALDLMTATHDRSWMHMLNIGSTITTEAWDHKYKNNLGWNHAWGAVPANIIPRYLLGVRPQEPGFSKVIVDPQPAILTYARGVVPTPRGPITVTLESGRRPQVDAPDGVMVTA